MHFVVYMKLNTIILFSQVQDAQAAMRLYTMHRKEWEKSRRNKYKLNAKRSHTASAKREQQASQSAEGEAV